ncbi:hypothetical protein HC776_02830, partial [bacterium]|nr:hypothetical protein [bacterium]
MLSGRLWPQIGGHPRYLDIIGVNYYANNQWILNGPALERTHPQHRPFRDMLRETHERYHRPLFIAETGTEGDGRPDWFGHIAREARAAMEMGISLEGL